MTRKQTEHTQAFYDKAYKKYKEEITKRGGVPILSRSNFERAYDQEKLLNFGTKKPVINSMVSEELYDLDYQSSRRLASKLKLEGEKVTFDQLRKMSNEDLKNKYGDYLSQMYRTRIIYGDTKKAAAAFVSEFWFGSL